MKQYLVTWVIDIWANDHDEAARTALAIQRREDSTALVFHVKDVGTKAEAEVDLLEGCADEIILPGGGVQ